MALLPSEPPHSTAPSAERGKPKDIPDIFKQSWGYQVRNFTSPITMKGMTDYIDTTFDGQQEKQISLGSIPKDIGHDKFNNEYKTPPSWTSLFYKEGKESVITIEKIPKKGLPGYLYKISSVQDEETKESKFLTYSENEQGEREIEWGVKADGETSRSIQLRMKGESKALSIHDSRTTENISATWRLEGPERTPIFNGSTNAKKELGEADGSLYREIILLDEKAKRDMFSEAWAEPIKALYHTKDSMESFIEGRYTNNPSFSLVGTEFTSQPWAKFLNIEQGDMVDVVVAKVGLPNKYSEYIFSCNKNGEERKVSFIIDGAGTHITISAKNGPYQRGIKFDEDENNPPKNLRDYRAGNTIDRTWTFSPEGVSSIKYGPQDGGDDSDHIGKFDHSLKSLFP